MYRNFNLPKSMIVYLLLVHLCGGMFALSAMGNDDAPVFKESGGVCVVEAEHGIASQNDDEVNWTRKMGPSAGNGEYMTTSTRVDNADDWETACEIPIRVQISTPGDYYVAARLIGRKNSNSAMWGVDGVEVEDNDFDDEVITWTWQRGEDTVDLTAGLHTINIRRRESGWKIDRLMIALESDQLPTGTEIGPPESQQIAGSQPVKLPPDTSEDLSELPRAVRDIIKSELGDISIDGIQQDDDEMVYKINAEYDGGQIDLRIAEDGTRLERREEIFIDGLPEAIRNTLGEALGDDYEIDKITKKTDPDCVFYDISVEIDDGEAELEIAVDGKLLLKRIQRDDDDDDDLSSSDLPPQVLETINKVVPGGEIEDIDTDRDDGVFVYEIDIDVGDVEYDLKVTADGILVDLEREGDDDTIIVGVELTAKSETPTLEDIAPYREALVLYEYRVEKRFAGLFNADTVRVAHWAIYDKQPQEITKAEIGSQERLELQPFSDFRELESIYMSDTLEQSFDVPMYHDIGQKILYNQTVQKRYDYRTSLSELMPAFWMLRDQLKLVALGDSRGEKGILPKLFYGEENLITPVAYNLSSSGAPLEFQETLIKEYLMKLPELEWVVYQMSPRVLNSEYDSSKKRDLVQSPAYAFDREHAEMLWNSPKNGTVMVQQILSTPYIAGHWDNNPWGGDLDDDTWDDPELDDDDMEGDWRLSSSRWDRLEGIVRMLAERNVHILIYLSPIHHIILKTPEVIDDDGTTREGYQDLLQRFSDLGQKYPNLVFADIHQGGNHDFGDELFGDLDHLNEAGATKLTKMLEEIRQQHQ